MGKKRTIIIGLDGVPYRLMQDLSEQGVMPNCQTLIEKGVFRQMESSIPEVSSVAWSSLITGVNPAEHGIFGFTHFPEGTYRLSFPNFSNLKAAPFWNKDNTPSVIINVPSTYPAAPLSGFLIAGFVALDLKKATYPSSLVPQLEEMNYQIDVDSGKAHQSLDLFLKDLERTLQSRIALYRYLWEKEAWGTFMLVFTGTDRLAHFLWDAYEDSSHKYHSAFLEHFQKIDEVIGEITGRVREEDSLILLSDHGFELLEEEVNINFLLQEKGYLKLIPGSPGNFADIDSATKAFALDPARIYLNRKDKYPRGSVEEKDKPSLLKDLEKAFHSLECKGRKVIKRICRREEIYQGPLLEQAPDLVLLPHKGFNLKANLKAKELFSKGVFTGKHTQEDAFLLVKDKANQDFVPASPSVFDVVGIMGKLREK